MRLKKLLKQRLADNTDPEILEVDMEVRVLQENSAYRGQVGKITNTVLKGTTVFYTVDFGIATTTFRESEVQTV